MNMKKKLSSILIALVMVMCLAPVAAFAGADGYTCPSHKDATIYYAKTNDNYHVAYCSFCSSALGGGYHSEDRAATCTTPAYCNKCKSTYGDKNLSNHSGSLNWTTTQRTHKQAYACCGSVVVAEATHVFQNDKCIVCNYTCSHTGGKATCQQGAICENCRVEYTGKNSNNHAGTILWDRSATTHKMGTTCCGIIIPEEAHSWENGACKVCGYVCVHFGGTATCTEKAECENCGAEYGNKNLDNHTGEEQWIQTATTHEQKWDCCGKVIIAREAHEWEDGVCSECSYVCGHSGGTAYCTAKAVCEICGEEYNETNPANHSGKEQWIQTATTHEQKWDCCGKVIIANEAHEWEDGVCSECDYVCEHSGGTATCTEEAECEICGEKYGKKASHWYGEWTSNGDGTHSASCRSKSCSRTATVGCLTFDFAVENEAGELTYCPVCGAVENGERLEKLEGAKAVAVTGTLSAGELVARMHDDYLSIAFEYAGKCTQPTGQVKITLPAELLEGKTLTLIAADGTETDLAFEIDSEGEYASFALDFTDAELPVMLIRLNAEA